MALKHWVKIGSRLEFYCYHQSFIHSPTHLDDICGFASNRSQSHRNCSIRKEVGIILQQGSSFDIFPQMSTHPVINTLSQISNHPQEHNVKQVLLFKRFSLSLNFLIKRRGTRETCFYCCRLCL